MFGAGYPRRLAGQAGRAAAVRRGQSARSRRMGGWDKGDGGAEKAPRGAKGRAFLAATSGSAPVAPRRLAPGATTRKAWPSAGSSVKPGQGAEGLGKARIQELRRLDAAGHPQRANWPCAACGSSRGPGSEEELDLQATIDQTAKNAGMLDIIMRPERTNRVKVLMFFDVGGSMDDHIRVCEELFSASPDRSSSTWSSTTSTTASMKACGRTTAAAMMSGPRHL